MKEEWAVIKGFPDYSVSNLGRVKSHERIVLRENNRGAVIWPEAILKPCLNTQKRYSVALYKNKVPYKRLIHRLVAEAFIPNPDKKPCINHINNNPLDNRMSNLEWCTYKENSEWMVKCGRWSGGEPKKPVIGINMKTGERVSFESISEAGRSGFERSNVSSCCAGRLKTHKGYKFHYA